MCIRDSGKVDAVITDPPYGVGFAYESHDDRNDGYADWCATWFEELQETRQCSPRVVAISCGISNLQMWPKPTWVMAWHKPASMGRCAVGFNNWEPVLIYGKVGRQIVDVFRATITPDDELKAHPCPKPCLLYTSHKKIINLDDQGKQLSSMGRQYETARRIKNEWHGCCAEDLIEARLDSERLDWLMRNLSGAEFRRRGVTYGGNCGRDRIDAAMNAGEPEWQNDVQAAFGGIVQTPQG